MRKSPGFDEGYWSIWLNRYPRFCAICIGESFRSCECTKVRMTTLCFRAKHFKSDRVKVRYVLFAQIH